MQTVPTPSAATRFYRAAYALASAQLGADRATTATRCHTVAATDVLDDAYAAARVDMVRVHGVDRADRVDDLAFRAARKALRP